MTRMRNLEFGIWNLEFGFGKYVSSGALIFSAIAMAVGMIFPASLRAAAPETVMVMLHVKPGLEDEAARVIVRHWETARRLNLVLDATHMTQRGTEEGDTTYFVEVLTWRDADIPDHAPAAIQEIWKEMNAIVETRGGRPGLHIVEVSIVGSSNSRP